MKKIFLWSGPGTRTNMYHLVRWDQISCTKEDRGVGIHDMKTMNKASLGKWWQRLSKATRKSHKQDIKRKIWTSKRVMIGET